MKLGEKIREARVHAGMTQSELAGDFITRNMLSQIENGLAMPSLQTALYIADKLGIDAGLLFSENDDTSVYFMTRKLPALKEKYASGDYEACIEICSENLEHCDEAFFILAESYVKKGIDLFGKGKMRQALKSTELALKYASKMCYSSDGIRLKVDMLEEMIANTTPFLKQTKKKPEEKKFLRNLFIENSEQKVFFARQSEAREFIENGQFFEAREIIKELLNEKNIYIPLLYTLYCDIEICCREQKDFENAYNYSNIAKKLFEDMQQ